MKKLLTLIAAIICSNMMLKAQDDLSKKVRFGIRVTPAINWMSPENDKKVMPNGSVLKAGIGLQLEFKLTETAWIQSGLEYTGAGMKADYQGSDSAYYIYKDDEITKAEISSNGNTIESPKSTELAGAYSHRLLTRKYNIGYLSVPLYFKFKTKEIGGLTYFGNIGGNLMFRTGTRVNDEVQQVAYSDTTGKVTTMEIEKINASSTMNIMTAAAGFGGGLEYNLSGSTSIFASITYQHHFMNATKKDSGYLIRSKAAGNPYFSEFQNGMKLRQIVLAVGILF